MIFWKKVEVDLEADRKRIRKCRYTSKERKWLLGINDLIEEGKLIEALKLYLKKDRGWGEYLDVDVFNLLSDVAYGEEIMLLKNMSLKLPAKNK